jgi:mannose-6-phosphate isomerase-like protein (cupin superfamily)
MQRIVIHAVSYQQAYMRLQMATFGGLAFLRGQACHHDCKTLAQGRDEQRRISVTLREVTDVAEQEQPVVVNVDDVQPVIHSCGASYRLITSDRASRMGLHVVDLADAKAHYHKRTCEVYYILEGKGALELNGRSVPVRAGTAIYVPPGVVHRALGRMRAVVCTAPAYDPKDEWLV